MQCLNLGDFKFNDKTSVLEISKNDFGSAKGMWNLIDFTSKGILQAEIDVGYDFSELIKLEYSELIEEDITKALS